MNWHVVHALICRHLSLLLNAHENDAWYWWDRCKEKKVTVQAAVSAASMLAMARAQAESHPLPQNILVQAPINMRKQVSICGWPVILFNLDSGLPRYVLQVICVAMH